MSAVFLLRIFDVTTRDAKVIDQSEASCRQICAKQPRQYAPIQCTAAQAWVATRVLMWATAPGWVDCAVGADGNTME